MEAFWLRAMSLISRDSSSSPAPSLTNTSPRSLISFTSKPMAAMLVANCSDSVRPGGGHVQVGHQAVHGVAAALQQRGVDGILVGGLHAQLRRLLGATGGKQGGNEGESECALHCETTFMLTAR